ncbi:putative tryptophanase [Vibrio cholerae]|nr:putative tryptophanase [Vibrio cholerae]
MLMKFFQSARLVLLLSIMIGLVGCKPNPQDDIALFQPFITENINKKSADPYISSTVKPGDKMYDILVNIQHGKHDIASNKLQSLIEGNDSDEMVWYAKNVLRLRDFFSKAFSQPYENPNDQDKATYMRSLNTDYAEFKKYMFWLTQNNLILEKTTLSSARRARLSPVYTALPASDKAQLEHLKTMGYRLVNWLPEK